MKQKRLHNGFTLLEVLLYLSLSMIMLAVLSGIGADVLEGRTKAEMEEDAVRNARTVYETVQYVLGDTHTILYPEPGNSSSSLQVLIGNDERPVSFWVEDQTVVMLDAEGNTMPLTDYTTSLSVQFTNLDSNTKAIKVDINAQAHNERAWRYAQASTSLSSTITLR